MRTFNVGDRVYHIMYQGQLGTVIEVGLAGVGASFAHVIWDKGNFLHRTFGDKGSVHPFQNLRLHEVATLKYDPMQQGDTDEDI